MPRIEKIIKRFVTVATSLTLFFSGTNINTVAANNNYSNEKSHEGIDSLENEQGFVEDLRKQFKSGRLKLNRNSNKYIESIYINNHKVTIKLKSGNTYTKEVKSIEINDLTLNDFWILNNQTKNSEEQYCRINNVNVLGEFKTNDYQSVEDNIDLSSCEAIWIDSCTCLLNKDNWQSIFGSDSLRHLILTNSTIKPNAYLLDGNYKFEISIYTKKLQTFVLTGNNTSLVDLQFINPRSLTTAVYGDNTIIETLDGLSEAINLKYYKAGINFDKNQFRTLSINSFIKEIQTSNETKRQPANVIRYISGLSATQIQKINMRELPHALDYMELFYNNRSIREVTGTDYYFTLSELNDLEKIGILIPEEAGDSARRVEHILNRTSENISDYDRVKMVVKEYIKNNKMSAKDSFELKQKNCTDLILLLRQYNIEAFSLLNGNDVEYDDLNGKVRTLAADLVVVINNQIAFININKLNNVLYEGINLEADRINNGSSTLGETIDKDWEEIIEGIKFDGYIRSVLPDRYINESKRLEGFIIPYEIEFNINNVKTKSEREVVEISSVKEYSMFNEKQKCQKPIFKSYSVGGVDQSKCDAQSCMSKNMRKRFLNEKIKCRVPTGSNNEIKYPIKTNLSPAEKKRLEETNKEIGYRF